MTKGERIKRGFHRLGLLFVALCVVAAGEVLWIASGDPHTPEMLGIVGVTALVGYGLLWLIGWAIAGFFQE